MSQTSEEDNVPLREMTRKRTRYGSGTSQHDRTKCRRHEQESITVEHNPSNYELAGGKSNIPSIHTFNSVPLEFQDDKTGRKKIHPSALRHCLKIVEHEARRTTQSVARSLIESDKMEESRRVQARSLQHEKKIVASVREKLRKTLIPARYVRIGDVVLDGLEAINRKRIEDIYSCKSQLNVLKVQKQKFVEKHRSTKEAFEQARESLGQKSNAPNHVEIHSLLKGCIDKSVVIERNSSCTFENDTRLVGTNRPLQKDYSFSAFLEKLPAKYD